MNDTLLVIVVTPDLEETVVDWLLGQERLPAFTSMPISGHGVGPGQLNVAEQVVGRQRQVMFHVLAEGDWADALLEDMRQRFAGTGISYWRMPLLGSGRL